MSEEDIPAPGSVKAPETVKAGCGIRYAEDELQAGVDFSAAQRLLEACRHKLSEEEAATGGAPMAADDSDQ